MTNQSKTFFEEFTGPKNNKTTTQQAMSDERKPYDGIVSADEIPTLAKLSRLQLIEILLEGKLDVKNAGVIVHHNNFIALSSGQLCHSFFKPVAELLKVLKKKKMYGFLMKISPRHISILLSHSGREPLSNVKHRLPSDWSLDFVKDLESADQQGTALPLSHRYCPSCVDLFRVYFQAAASTRDTKMQQQLHQHFPSHEEEIKVLLSYYKSTYPKTEGKNKRVEFTDIPYLLTNYKIATYPTSKPLKDLGSGGVSIDSKEFQALEPIWLDFCRVYCEYGTKKMASVFAKLKICAELRIANFLIQNPDYLRDQDCLVLFFFCAHTDGQPTQGILISEACTNCVYSHIPTIQRLVHSVHTKRLNEMGSGEDLLQ